MVINYQSANPLQGFVNFIGRILMNIGYQIDIRESINLGELAQADILATDLTTMGKTFKLFPLKNGDIVKEVSVHIVTPITGPTGTPTITIQTQDVNFSYNSILSTKSIVATATTTYVDSGAYSTSGTDEATFGLYAVFLAGGGNSAAATAGKIRVNAKIMRYKAATA